MMRNLLRYVALLGVLVLVAALVLHQYTFAVASAVLAPHIHTALVGIQHWLHAATAHLTTTQILEGAGLAWFIFVLALVLLARSGRTGSRTYGAYDTAMKISDERAVGDSTLPQQAQELEATVYSNVPTSSPSTAHNEKPADYLDVTELTSEPSRGYPPSSPATASKASDVLTKPRIEPELPSVHTSDPRTRPAFQQTRGHMAALTGIAQADGKLVPYGVFLVAEDVGTPYSAGAASRRAVEIIAKEIAPSLATNPTLGNAQLPALLKMAVMRASLDLREQCIRTATSFEAAITGVIVIDDIAHIVNVGDCRAYVFRPSQGLLQITTDHSVISCLVESGLLQPDAVYQHPRRDQVYRSVGGNQVPSEIDTFEIRVRPNDLLLLCSPALWQALRLPQIEYVLTTAPDPQAAAVQLAHAGTSRTGNNDVSVIVVRPLGEWMPRFGVSAGQTEQP